MTKYLDITELAALLGMAQSTIRKKLSQCPGCLPPQMHLPGSAMRRWRSREVENWMYETGWSAPKARRRCLSQVKKIEKKLGERGVKPSSKPLCMNTMNAIHGP